MSSPEFNTGVTGDPFTALGSGKWIWILRVLTTVALGISGYLMWTALTGRTVAGCGSGELFDCQHVLNSKWSKFGPLPVGLLAFVLYSCVLSALVFCRHPQAVQVRRISWMCVTVCGFAAGLAAVWFTSLQIFALDQLCPWCLGAHACGLAICGLVLWKHPFEARTSRRLAFVGILSVAVLITGQILIPAPLTHETVRFDAQSNGTAVEDSGDSLDGEVTDDVFTSPDNIFEAPAVNLFEAPTEPSETDSVTNDEPDVESSEEDASAATAASLLLLMPPHLSLMTNRVLVSTGSDDEDSRADKSAQADPAVPEEVKPERRVIGVNGNKFRLDVRQWPLLGQPDAKYVFVEMFDYTCSHCRNTHRAVRGAFKRYGDDLAVIALPVPLDRNCNRYATSSGGTHRDSCEISRIAIAVWRIDAEKFYQLHNWLFETNRTAISTKRRAEQLVGRERLATELNYPTAGQYIGKHVELYHRVGGGAVPKLMFPNSSMIGEVSSTQTLCNAIERELASR
ncbi:MAG: thioredoxin domain-containing protein [Fuerstiella sp.]|nr:thioredoxin domain-containing protein [Fuerstiella sp.]